MNPYKQLLRCTILFGSLGFATMFLGTPSCKAQEISSDHFTDTGVQNVFENVPEAPTKVTKAGTHQKQASSGKRQVVLAADRKSYALTAKRVVVGLRE